MTCLAYSSGNQQFEPHFTKCNLTVIFSVIVDFVIKSTEARDKRKFLYLVTVFGTHAAKVIGSVIAAKYTDFKIY